MSPIDACPCRRRADAAIVDTSTDQPQPELPPVTSIVAVAVVLITFIAIAIAVVDTARFTRRTGNQVPADLAYRAYLV
jgi:hypothetical protein